MTDFLKAVINAQEIEPSSTKALDSTQDQDIYRWFEARSAPDNPQFTFPKVSASKSQVHTFPPRKEVIDSM